VDARMDAIGYSFDFGEFGHDSLKYMAMGNSTEFKTQSRMIAAGYFFDFVQMGCDLCLIRLSM
jgi:hypothetical protein